MKDSNNEKWLSSKEAMSEGEIQACDLMHFRTAGKLQFEKKGNAFFYKKSDIKNLKK